MNEGKLNGMKTQFEVLDFHAIQFYRVSWLMMARTASNLSPVIVQFISRINWKFWAEE